MLPESLIKWVKDHFISPIDIVEYPFCYIPTVGQCLIVRPNEGEPLFDREGNLALSDMEVKALSGDVDIDYLIFELGDKWYKTTDPVITNILLLESNAIGVENEFQFPFLAIHGGYDLCNGLRTYDKWCKRAKALDYKTLGIAEDNTLAGIVAFQNACVKNDIKPIIGETVYVKHPGQDAFPIKLYVIDEEGWKSLLRINAYINVEHEGLYITFDELTQHTKGLFCLLSPEVNLAQHFFKYSKAFDTRLFYQLSFTHWDSPERDVKWLNHIQIYLNEYANILPPILAPDAFFFYPYEYAIRKDLNAIGKLSFKYQSKDLCFKPWHVIVEQAFELFDDSEWSQQFIIRAIEGAQLIATNCNFQVKSRLRLPQFDAQDNDELFFSLIQQGLEEKIINKGLDVDLYLERIEKEVAVITKGGFVSYFLILWDIVKWCKQNNIWTGIGRGSAAGCLVSYLLDIVGVDPIQYNLLFERFLNESRITKGLPDIDIDFQGSRREEVKRYIESKYGANQVTSIGTYGTFKIKAAIQALARRNGGDIAFTNYATGAFETDEMTFPELMKCAIQTPIIYEYVQNHPRIIEKLQPILEQPHNSSIHAAGVVIVPKEDGDIFAQMPVKKVDGILVSEWEGEFIDQVGFLKCDILGIKQLDKFAEITALIAQTDGVSITYNDIPLDSQKVYEYFCNGWNQDVFQFGGRGLRTYCQDLQPSNIEDLIATVALYRPGPIEMGAPEQYVRLKNGKAIAVYDYMLQDVTKNTYGLFVYQEQIMFATQVLGGFSLIEADDIRKAMGKKLPELMASYKQKFIEGALQRGATPTQAESVWNKMEGFGGYAFNRSHATCYAITGYYCQWFKVHYPLHFWAVSLKHAKDDQRKERIMEIASTSSIQLAPIDINKSEIDYAPDFETNSIYWSILSISNVGPKAVEAILSERQKGGLFFSLEEFVARSKEHSAINKRTYLHLILAGAFDQIQNISNARHRFDLIKKLIELLPKSFSEQDLEPYKTWQEHHWLIKQRELCGYAAIDFEKMLHKTLLVAKKNRYKTTQEALEEEPTESIVLCGMMTHFEIKTSKKNGTRYASIQINDGVGVVHGTIWSDALDTYSDELNQVNIGQIIAISGKTTFDRLFKKANVFQSTNKTIVNIVK